MSRISISQAAKDFNISRNTLYKKIKNGEITKDSDGKLDTSDLVRLFTVSNTANTTNEQNEQPSEQLLFIIEQQKEMINELKEQITYLKANEYWLKEQLNQKLLTHNTKKGLLSRLFGD